MRCPSAQGRSRPSLSLATLLLGAVWFLTACLHGEAQSPEIAPAASGPGERSPNVLDHQRGGTSPTILEATGEPLADDERVSLYPAFAYPTRRGWAVEAEGMVYEPSSAPSTLLLLGGWLGLKPGTMTEEQRERLRRRMDPFFVDHERGKRFTIPVPGSGGAVRTERSGADGRFRFRWEIPHAAAPQEWTGAGGVWSRTVRFPIAGRPKTNGVEVTWTIHAMGSEGWSVVSDIDDTIKVSHVLDRAALIRKTFLEPFEAVPGMAEQYQTWAAAGGRFHYVSASPWQLHDALEQFRAEAGFPLGTFHLKRLRPAETSSVVALFGDQRRHKLGIIGELLKRFPRRQFVLIGDSGEQDPEIYGELARRHPGQIRAIAIRQVTAEEAGHPRYESAFKGVPRQAWRIFKQAGDLVDLPVASPAH